MMKSRSRNKASLGKVFLAVAAVGLAWSAGAGRALGADSAWTGGGGSASPSWGDPNNWTAGSPGAILPATTSDTASFTLEDSYTGNRTINIDAGRAIKNVTIVRNTSDPANGNLYTFGTAVVNEGPALSLANGGALTTTFNGGNPEVTNSHVVNAPLALLGATYTFNNTAAEGAPNAGLLIRGDVSGANPGAATTLNLITTNRNAGSNSTNTQVSGKISDGTSLSLKIVKTGTGWWMFNQAAGSQNTYSGTTEILEGTMRFNGAGAMSPNSDLIIKQAGTFRPSLAGTFRSMSIISTPTLTAPISSSGSTITVTFSSSLGPAVLLDYSADSIGTTRNFSLSTVLGGTVANEGGLKMIPGANVAMINFQQYLSVGSVERIVEIGHGGQNLAAGGNTVDFQFSNIDGTGTFVKTGAGLVVLNGTANTLSGALEVRDGKVTTRNVANAFTSPTKPLLKVTGGTLDVQSSTQTFGAVTVTAGTLAGNFSTTALTQGTIAAPSFTFNVNGSSTANATAFLADAPSTSASLNMAGSGTVTLSGSLLYTGNTSVTGTGTLVLGQPLRPVTSSLVVTGAGKAQLAASASATTNVQTSDLASISVGTGGVVQVTAANRPTQLAKVLVTGTLSVTGGTVDLTNNDAVIHGMSETAVRALVASWWNGGLRNGPGLASSLSGTGSGRDAMATLAVVSNNAGGAPRVSTFDGVTVVSSDVLVKYTYLGDTDLSGVVDATDLSTLITAIRTNKTGWINGDTNYDGVVNATDYSNLLTAMRLQTGSFAEVATGGGVTGAIPEPMGLGVMLLAVPLLARRRR